MARLVIDAMNVIGTRPTGWWRDVPAAVRELLTRVDVYARTTGDEVTVVLDGRVPAGIDVTAIAVVPAEHRGRDAADDRIVALVEADVEPATLTVVTSDRQLRARVEVLGARTSGPSEFLRRLDAV